MLALLLGGVLAQSPPVSPPQVAAPDLTVVGLDANRAALFTEHLAQQLTAVGFTVVTAKQISSLLGHERQKQLLGCSEDSSSCMAELAAALGSDALITGSVARLSESAYQVNVTITSAADGKPIATLSSREASEEAVLDVMTREAPRLAQEAYPRLRPGHTFKPASRGLRRYAWIPAAAGGLFVIAGLGLVVSSWNDSDQLRGAGVFQGMTFSMSDARSLASAGQTKQTFGWVLGSVGVAALAAAGVMALLGGDSPAQVVVAPSPGGATLALSGALP